MYNLPITGNLAHDLDLQTNPTSGVKRVNFTLMVNEGERGTDSEKTHRVPITVFGHKAENLVKTAKKGDRLTATVRLNSYQKSVHRLKDGDTEETNLNMISFTATEVGANLTFATAEITRNPKGAGREGNSFPAEEPAAAAPKAAPAKPAAAAAPAAAADDMF